MVSADPDSRVNENPLLKRIAYVFMATGFIIISASFVIGIALGMSIADLFENAKSVRDSAAAGDGATAGILSWKVTVWKAGEVQITVSPSCIVKSSGRNSNNSTKRSRPRPPACTCQMVVPPGPTS